jgi:hypothetical protein
MLKPFIILTAFAALLFSCTNSDNLSSSNSEEGVANQKDEVTQRSDFEIINITRKEFIPNFRKEELTAFLFDFDVINNTESSINQFALDIHIKVTFQDGTTETRPIEGGESVFMQSSGKAESNWKQGASQTFKIELPQKGDYYHVMFYNSEFKRTPAEAKVICDYKAIGIDGEFSNSIEIDLLDEWKLCQTKLGLR